MLAAPRVLLLGNGMDDYTTSNTGAGATPATPTGNVAVKANMSVGSVSRLVRRAAARRAAQTFVRDAAHTSLLPTLRSFLKLYTTIPVSKLARFLDVSVDACRTQLLAYKQQSRVIGARVSAVADLSFYVENDIVHISDGKQQHNQHGEYFLHHLSKFDDMMQQLQKRA